MENNEVNPNNNLVNDENQNVQTTQMTENVNYQEEPVKKKNKALPIIIIVGVLVVFGVVAFFVTRMFNNTKPYEQAIDQIFKIVKSNYNTSKSYKINANLTLNSKGEDYAFLDNISIDTTTGIDASNNKSFFAVNYSEAGKKLIGLESLIDNNKIYVQLKDIYSKVLYYDISDMSEELAGTPKVETEDIEYLMDTFERMLKASLKDESPKKENVTAKVNNQDVSYTAYKYTINKTSGKRISNNMFNVLLNDEKAISIISKYSNQSQNDVTSTLKDMLNEEDDFDQSCDLIIYTKGGSIFSGLGLSVENMKIFDFYVNNGYTLFTVNNEEINFTLEGTEKNQTFRLEVEKNELVSGSIVKNNTDDYTLTVDVPEILTAKMNIKKEDASSIGTIDTTNAVDLSKLSDSEAETITTNITKALEKSKIYNYFMSMMEDSE